MDIRGEEILSTSFNQDQECFICGTNYGFKIFNACPFKLVLVRDLGGGIGIVEMLYKSNFIALVGGGRNPKFALNKVVMWDDYQGKVAGEVTFTSQAKIRAVRLRENKMVVWTENRLYVHNLQDLSFLKRIEVDFRHRGQFCWSLNEAILCYPNKADNCSIDILNLENNTCVTKKAHSTPIFLMEVNFHGDKVATASEKGTIIRIFDTADGTLLQELRRGTERHLVLSIQFSIDSSWLLCASDSGTAHVFNIGQEGQIQREMESANKKKDALKNNKSKLSFLKHIHSYFDSEWSYSSLKMPEKFAKIAFRNSGKEKEVMILTKTGGYHLVSFNKETQGKVLQSNSFRFK